MEINILEEINPKLDKWILPDKTSVGNSIVYDFTFLPNDWMKEMLKK